MEILYLILISTALVIVAVGAMSIRLMFVKDGKFSGGSCRSSPELEKRGITCGCGQQESCATGNERSNKNEIRKNIKYTELRRAGKKVTSGK